MCVLSLCGTKHMNMRYRNEWLAWAATAVGSLGLVGLAAAQHGTPGTWDLASTEVPAEGPVPHGVVIARPDRSRPEPITDDGWSTEVPVARQVVVARRDAKEPLHIDLYNERGEVVDHIEWPQDASTLKPLALDALAAGRYAVRVAGTERSEVIRFRKE